MAGNIFQGKGMLLLWVVSPRPGIPEILKELHLSLQLLSSPSAIVCNERAHFLWICHNESKPSASSQAEKECSRLPHAFLDKGSNNLSCQRPSTSQARKWIPLVASLNLLLPGTNINAHVRRQQPATPASPSLYFNKTAGRILSQVEQE